MSPKIAVALLALSLWARAQIGHATGMGNNTRLIVHVVYEDERPAGKSIEVQLINDAGQPISQSVTDELGEVQFRVTPGNYRLEFKGQGIEEKTSEDFSVPGGAHFGVTMRITRKKIDQSAGSSETSVSVTDLKAPDNAAAEFNQAQSSLKRNDLKKARKQFEEAIRLYPSYASAYNGLGVVYLKQGDLPGGRQAFEKAAQLDDHFGLPYVNLSKMAMKGGDYKKASSLLQHALAISPQDPETLMLAAQADLLVGNYDDAIQDAQKVHSMLHPQFSTVHYIAARAFRHKKLTQQAIAEYKLFLEEAPKSTATVHAQAELEALQKTAH